MKIDKAIFGVDNSYFLEFWPLQSKICKELLDIEPVLFYICDEDSDFYYDGNGLVKKIKKVDSVNTGLLACIVRMYGSKYFPDEVCLTCDLDMLMINKDYFVTQIQQFNNDSLVIFTSDAYDLKRPEAAELFKTQPFPFTQEMYGYPYNAAKGKIFNKILDTDCSFEDFVRRHNSYKVGYHYMWMIDEFYFADCVNNKEHGVEVNKLIRGHSSPWKANRRIDRHNFPVQLEYQNEIDAQLRDGVYQIDLLEQGYYIDANCCRPYSKYKEAIDNLINIVLKNNTERKNNIEYLSTEVNEGLVYFKYHGVETNVNVKIKYNGMTAYNTNMYLSTNQDVIYYIGCNNFFKNVNNFILEITYNDKNYSETIPISLNNEKKINEYNFSTQEEDSSFYSFKEIFLDKIYNSNNVKVEPNDLVVDIGSNYGFFSYLANEMGARKIICYEPSLGLQKHLQSNLKDLNIEIFQKAVSGNNGKLKFEEYNISSAHNQFSKNDSGYFVDVIGINELIDSIRDVIDFLKIDCEGAEIKIFKKITSDRINKIKKLVVEYHEETTKDLITNKLLSENFFIEKIENNVIYAYNTKLVKQPKKVALISTFCDTEEKLNILEENLIKIKKLSIDIIAISPIEIPQRIVNLCDYFFYTKDNELLRWPIRMYTHWYEMKLPDGGITTLQRGLADYGWAGLHQVKKLSQIALTFDYDMFYHMIYDLEIDDVVETEFKSNNINIVHPRRDPHHSETLWETTLHFMVFDRDMMQKIEKEITLDEYLRTNGMAEGEVLKWKNKYNIPTSNHPVKDKIFYWGDYDFFNYSPFPDFKMFLSKNEPITIWLGESPVYDAILPNNLRIVFHGFESMRPIEISVNGVSYLKTPKPWEIIEFPINSQEITELIFTYNNQTVNFIEKYNDIMMNQIYYNHRP